MHTIDDLSAESRKVQFLVLNPNHKIATKLIVKTHINIHFCLVKNIHTVNN